jgi:hypothetical protein
LEEEELSFYRMQRGRCSVVDDDAVEVDADVVDAADRSRGRRGRRVDVVESQPRSEVRLLSSPRALFGIVALPISLKSQVLRVIFCIQGRVDVEPPSADDSFRECAVASPRVWQGTVDIDDVAVG